MNVLHIWSTDDDASPTKCFSMCTYSPDCACMYCATSKCATPPVRKEACSPRTCSSPTGSSLVTGTTLDVFSNTCSIVTGSATCSAEGRGTTEDNKPYLCSNNSERPAFNTPAPNIKLSSIRMRSLDTFFDSSS